MALEDLKKNKKFMICLKDALQHVKEGDFYESCPAKCYESRYNTTMACKFRDDEGFMCMPIYCKYCKQLFHKITIGGACPCSHYGTNAVIDTIENFIGKENS